jgi:hypothetical protein
MATIDKFQQVAQGYPGIFENAVTVDLSGTTTVYPVDSNGATVTGYGIYAVTGGSVTANIAGSAVYFGNLSAGQYIMWRVDSFDANGSSGTVVVGW